MSKSVGSAVKKKLGVEPTVDSIRVICRVRPQNDRERGTENAVECDEDSGNMRVKNSYAETQSFAFDAVLGPLGTQERLYDISASEIVHDVTRGFNGTVFAYGQTSSGKTHTMQGPNLSDPSLKGVIPRALDHMFEYISRSAEDMEFVVKVSLIEIYMERIRDLFDPTKTDLKIREDKSKGIWIENVSEICVGSPNESMDLLRFGQSNRSIAATLMNAESSRSHSIFIVSLLQKSSSDTKESKLYLVDLAGSEKVRKTGAEGQVLEEAKMINKSLSALGNVINALTDPKTSHIPYRDSKLTRILQESLGGNSKTCLIINCSPSLANEDETLSTLRFGQRAKFITNKAQVNIERSPAELLAALSAAEKEIEALKEKIRVTSPTSPSAPDSTSTHAEQMIAQLRLEKQELEVDMEALVHQLDFCVQEAASRDSRLDELSEQLQQAQLLLKNVNSLSAENDRLHDEIDELNIKLRASLVSDCSKTERVSQLLEENKVFREIIDSTPVSSEPSAPAENVRPIPAATATSKGGSSPNPFYDSPSTPIAEEARFSATNISVDSHNTTVEGGTPTPPPVAWSLFSKFTPVTSPVTPAAADHVRSGPDSTLQVPDGSSASLIAETEALRTRIQMQSSTVLTLSAELQRAQEDLVICERRVATKNERIRILELMLADQPVVVVKEPMAVPVAVQPPRRDSVFGSRLLKPLRGGTTFQPANADGSQFAISQTFARVGTWFKDKLNLN